MRVLFLIYINDIDSNLLCAISKFADGTKLLIRLTVIRTGTSCNRTYSTWWNGQPSGKCHSMIQSAVLFMSVHCVLYKVHPSNVSSRLTSLIVTALLSDRDASVAL